MNRQERRKLEKSNNKESVMERYRHEAFDEGYKRGMQDSVDINFYMTAYTIQYKLGFGRKRLQWIMKAIYNNIDSYRTGHLEPKDYDTIVDQMRNEYGIKLN